MKKLLTLLLAVLMLVSLAACGGKTEPTEPTEPEVTEATYKLGMGTEVSLGSSKAGNAQVDATVAAVVLNADGQIVKCTIDVIQNKMDISEGTVDTTKTFLTKMEKGDDYGMLPASAIGKEWYDQTLAFAEYCVGKTAADIEGTTTHEANGHNVADDEVLYASCSMDITGFKAAVLKACNDEQGMTFTASNEDFKLGVACSSTAASSTDAGEEDGVVKMYSDMSCAVVADGVIVAALTDAIQPNITFDAEGEIVETSFKATKRELKEDYNMLPVSPIGKEWYEQAAAFVEFCVGKTAAEVAGLETVESNGHMVAADEALHASCSMQITAMSATVARAAELAVAPLH